jgi:serine/threonine protein kinase
MLKRSEPTLHYPFGVVKILDMGLARCTDAFASRASTHLTQIGSVMGTPEFIAPEQARDSHNSDIRADLYSLGCTLYFLLTGQPPFPNGTITEKLLQHQFNDPDPVDVVRREALQEWAGAHDKADAGKKMLHVPAAVDRVVRRLLAKDPGDRHQTPIALANDLQSILQRMADGTLEREEELEKTAEMAAVPAVQTRVQPIIQITPQSLPGSMAGKIAMLSAALGAIACIVCVTVFAVLFSAGGLTRANSKPDEEPKSNFKTDDGKGKK